MERYQIILSYDGTAFHGMQRQTNARSVQGEVETALRKIGWQGASILAAGRTDSGVHASGQVVTFDHEWKHSNHDLQNALNAALPEDVAVNQVEIVSKDFHPRYDAQQRVYQYQVFCSPHRDPLRERYAWRVWPMLDCEKMNAAAAILVGTHDFAAFGTPQKKGGSTQREVFSADWQQDGEEFRFVVVANAYLYHMVRRMVKILVEVGHCQRDADEISEYLNRLPKEIIPGLAPPQGLFLRSVRYHQNSENKSKKK